MDDGYCPVCLTTGDFHTIDHGPIVGECGCDPDEVEADDAAFDEPSRPSPRLSSLALYLLAVASHGVPLQYQTRVCPECGDDAPQNGGSNVSQDGHLHSDDGWIIVGCEGYHIVRPSTVGLVDGAWSDWTDEG